MTSDTSNRPLNNQSAASFRRARSAQARGLFDEAVRGFRAVLQKHPHHFETLFALGEIAVAQGREVTAQAYFQRAAAAAPDDFRPLHNLATLALKSSRLADALKYAQASARLAPDNPAAHQSLASVSIVLGRPARDLRQVENAFAAQPDDFKIFLKKVLLKRQVCDWRNYDSDDERIRKEASYGSLISPFLLLSTEAGNAEQSACSRRWAHQFEKHRSEHLPIRRPNRNGPIKLGYLSGDFHDHATSRLVGELFESHDRQRVTVHGYSYGPDRDGHARKRIAAALDVFRDVKNLSSRSIAERIHGDAIDILVDLKGYTSRARTEILSWRPAPVQVNYLGFPCTMEANFIDYAITDRVVSPPEYQIHSQEKFAYLPNCFQPNDTRRPIPDGSATRARYGISEDAFVFCCFNAAYKISPKIFSVWMRILEAVPHGVLWVLVRSEEQATFLTKEAVSRGIDASRIICAPHASTNEHLARCALADLFLDTLPVSAFTTASDALWAGLPVLTCAGPTPAGRGSASLLTAMGVPELVTSDLAAYEALAVQLASDNNYLARLRRKIESARFEGFPFNPRGLARDLEALYGKMIAAAC
ncbi:tetratricopeptide repeat protein [Tianweitania sediminis]|uniref:protein O-GlcNAc transferase n=1 Tax=Tianweitania sediminis TaxID=1502156 RepID=A0A8J7RA39_9HYPH|nr:tetratricopeptide repeat protein [Tianweitania sediminis]MBP0441192.1 tetratricopeptide repeat protein [Tianweitania sediminis]